MPDEKYTIQDMNNRLVEVRLRRDKRLRKTSRWEHLVDGSLLVRIPMHMPKRAISPMLDSIRKQLDKPITAYKHHTDIGLQQRAERINRKYFGGKFRWSAIRWVSNMHTRLGSYTRGGATDGEIRISDRIKTWPGWVVDYVIAHELLHGKHANHSPAYWSELYSAYPLADKARGFIEGVFYKTGLIYDESDE